MIKTMNNEFSELMKPTLETLNLSPGLRLEYLVFGKYNAHIIHREDWCGIRSRGDNNLLLNVNKERKRLHGFVEILESLEVGKLEKSTKEFCLGGSQNSLYCYLSYLNGDIFNNVHKSIIIFKNAIEYAGIFTTNMRTISEFAKGDLISILDKHFNTPANKVYNLSKEFEIVATWLDQYMNAQQCIKLAEPEVPLLYEMLDNIHKTRLSIADVNDAIAEYHDLLLEYVVLTSKIDGKLADYLKVHNC